MGADICDASTFQTWHLFIYFVFVYGESMHVTVASRKQRTVCGSQCSPFALWACGLNSGCQTWKEELLPTGNLTGLIMHSLLANSFNILYHVLWVFRKKLFYFLCMSILPTSIDVHHMWTWCFQRPEAGIRFHGTGGTDGLKQAWVLGTKSRPLQEQWVVWPAEPSPDPGFLCLACAYTLLRAWKS